MTQAGSNDENNWRSKISFCPFKSKEGGRGIGPSKAAKLLWQILSVLCSVDRLLQKIVIRPIQIMAWVVGLTAAQYHQELWILLHKKFLTYSYAYNTWTLKRDCIIKRRGEVK